ncbi:hypothetical protein LQX96_004652 [Salmonella enterica]|nr:hypothetical protein [Salmonella enterica]
MSNDMYFDPSSFDFTNLVDVVETEPTAPKPGLKLDEVTPDGGMVDDISDLADLFAADEDEESKESTDLNDNVSDLLTNHDVDNDKITIFNDLPDEATLIFDGHEMSKKQVKELFQAKQIFDEQKELVSTAANSIDQIHRHLQQEAIKHATAIDLNIQNIQRKMNSNISATEYGELSRQLNSAIDARNSLNASVDERMRLLDVERAETTRFRIAQTDQAMQAEIPQWNQLKGGLLQDMQARGVNLGELEKIWSKDVAMMALNDYRYRKGREKVGAAAMEAAKAKAPRSTSTAANAQRQQALDATAAKKAALLKKARSGGLSREDHAAMFNYLVD